MSSKKLFKILADNAVSLLRESVEELEKSPKRSLISFATAIELFLKARLLMEHWALIYDKPQDAHQTKFHEGDFYSVGLKECAKRLSNICGVQIHPNELKQFETIHEHRNKLIHFFHPDLEPHAKEEFRQDVLKAELVGWHYLTAMLQRKDFEPHFRTHMLEIVKIKGSMRQQKGFLKEKYLVVKKGLKSKSLISCPYCEFDATEITRDDTPLLQIVCHVCETQSSRIQTTCPECGHHPINTEGGKGTCEKCDGEITLDDLLDQFGNCGTPKDELIDPSVAYCSDCSEEAVITHNEDWLCLNCAVIHDETGNCSHCGTLVTGNLQWSALNGCSQCEGPDLRD